MNEKWQRIASYEQIGKTYVNTFRLMVPGGWIVRTSEQCTVGFVVAITASSTFVPDPDRIWTADTV